MRPSVMTSRLESGGGAFEETANPCNSSILLEDRSILMAIYEIKDDHIRAMDETTFAAAGISERGDLQRLLREQVEIISPDTLVVAEEFGEWEESRRRIDLLGIDKDANLVVIELKRTEDGGHMELQAIRYAAMVSTLTFDKVVDVYDRYLRRMGREESAQREILEFLEWEEPDEDLFGQDVRIVLASAEFSKELTTAVMWLNDREIDIRCVRIRPYKDETRLLIDVQQVIPLPEATEYQIHIREKERQERKGRAERYSIRKQFWEGLLRRAREKTDLHANISPSEYHWIGAGSGVRGLGFHYVVTKDQGSTELYIDRGSRSGNESKELFDLISANKDQVETAFGGPLEWQRLNDKRACRIRFAAANGGYRDDPENWPKHQDAMIDAMVRLEKALRPQLEGLKVRRPESEPTMPTKETVDG